MNVENIDTLPVYYPDISDSEDGVFKISLVEFPAFEVDFKYYSKNDTKNYQIFNEEKREIIGVVIKADTPVYRNDKPIGPHYMLYPPDVVRDIRDRFFKDKYTDASSINHATDVDGVYVVGSFISDDNIQPKGFEDIPKGSWYVIQKIENDEVWQLVKEGNVKGFSMEISHSYINSGKEMKLNYNLNYMNTKRTTKKSINYQRVILKKTGKKPSSAYSSVLTDKGEIAFEGQLEEGKEDIVLFTNDGAEVAPDGEYDVLNDANEVIETIVVEDGEVIEIKDDNQSTQEGEGTSNMEEEDDPETDVIKDIAIEEIAAVIDTLIQEVEEVKEYCNTIEAKYNSAVKELEDANKKIYEKLKLPRQNPDKKDNNYTAVFESSSNEQRFLNQLKK